MIEQNKLTLHASSSLLELNFTDGFSEMLSFEMLRVNSPAVKAGNCDSNMPLLVTNKAYVQLESLQQVESKGVRLFFNDGHDSGLFSWQDLYRLAKNQDQLWSSYLKRIKIADSLKLKPLDVIVDYFSPRH